MNKLNISIGIPAFNEQANITKLLISILEQAGDSFIIKEIIVVSDGSTDRTADVIRKMNNPLIRIIINSRRMGQCYSQNLILAEAKENIVVLFEADTLLGTKFYLEEMVKLFSVDETIALIQGNLIPQEGKTLISKILSKQAEVYHNFLLIRPNLLMWFSSGRGGRLFNRSALKNFFWPANIPEDAYALLWCRQQGKKIDFCIPAYCYYRNPQNMRDFAHQRRKLLSGPIALEQYFLKEEIEKVYNSSFTKKLRLFLPFAFFHPVLCAGYIILKLNMLRTFIYQPFSDNLEIANSTKFLESDIYEHI